VNIVIVNYNCWEDTVSCLNSIKSSTYTNFQIFIIDNASINPDLSNICDWLSKYNFSYKLIEREKLNKNEQVDSFNEASVILIKNHENRGYGAGNNVALNYLVKNRKEEFVWLLNPDTVIQNKVIEDLVDLANDKKKNILGNVMHHYDDKEKIIRYGGFKVRNLIHGISYITKQSQVNKLDAISGASFFTRSVTFSELGFLPEEYFMYWEETDFCTKAIKNGYSFGVNNKSKIFDRGGTLSNNNFLREYLYLFNGLKYYKKHKPFNLPLILISTVLKQVKAVAVGNNVKRKAIFYAHLDFISLMMGKEIDVQKRILKNRT
jgi:hypothetical protein